MIVSTGGQEVAKGTVHGRKVHQWSRLQHCFYPGCTCRRQITLNIDPRSARLG